MPAFRGITCCVTNRASLVYCCDIMTWCLLLRQDYHWWWRAFLTSGFTAVYFFIYCIHYYVSKLDIEGFVSTLLYFGYTFIMVFAFFLLTGQ